MSSSNLSLIFAPCLLRRNVILHAQDELQDVHRLVEKLEKREIGEVNFPFERERECEIERVLSSLPTLSRFSSDKQSAWKL